MSGTLVMLLAGGVGSRLNLLVSARAKPAVPFGGNYRIIDFTLSNIMNSGLERVGILTQYKPLSLMNHIGSGRAWDLTGRTRGITILPPQTGKKDSDWYKGTADALRRNLDFLTRYDTEQVLVVSGDHIYYMDYIPMIVYHQRHKADVTVAMREVPWDQAIHFGIGQKDAQGRIIHWEEKPKEPKSNLASIGVYLFRTEYLLKVLTETNAVDFGQHVVPQAIGRDRVFAYPFSGYWRDVGTLAFYFEAHQELLDPASGLNPEAWGIQTNLEEEGLKGDRLPIFIHRGARVSRSFLSSGVVIEGRVEGSILSPGVRVKKGAQVFNSIILHDGEIGAGAMLNRVILDKRVTVGDQARIDGLSTAPNRDFPTHLSEGITLVGKKAKIPPGQVIQGNCLLFPNLQPSDYPARVIEAGMTIRTKEEG
jgi:glucose-1-phosphate adenylyltransferase